MPFVVAYYIRPVGIVKQQEHILLIGLYLFLNIEVVTCKFALKYIWNGDIKFDDSLGIVANYLGDMK